MEKYFNLKENELLSMTKSHKVAYPRQIAMYIMREKMNYTLVQIAEFFGRDHSTIIHGINKIKKDIDTDIAGKNVLIIEDIADSGRALALIKEEFKKRGAKDVRIASLLSKPSRRVVDVEIEYIGTDIPDEFVVGYGLDMDEKYRQMDYIGVLKPEIYM